MTKKIIITITSIILAFSIVAPQSTLAIWDEVLQSIKPPVTEENDVPDTRTFAEKVNDLKARFREGEYFAGNSTTGKNLTESSPVPLCEYCTDLPSCFDGCGDDCGTYYRENDPKNKDYGLAWQCYAFACQMGFEVFGTDPYASWYRHYDLDSLVPGDMVRYSWSSDKFNPHVIFVTNVIGDKIYYADSNATGPCQISWSGCIDRAKLASYLENFQTVYYEEDKVDGWETTAVTTAPETTGTDEKPKGKEIQSRVGIYHEPNNLKYNCGVADPNGDGKYTAADANLAVKLIVSDAYVFDWSGMTQFYLYQTTDDGIIRARDSIILKKLLIN